MRQHVITLTDFLSGKELRLEPAPGENGHVRCKKNPTWTLRWDVGVKDEKLKIQRKRTVFRGKTCFEEGE